MERTNLKLRLQNVVGLAQQISLKWSWKHFPNDDGCIQPCYHKPHFLKNAHSSTTGDKNFSSPGCLIEPEEKGIWMGAPQLENLCQPSLYNWMKVDGHGRSPCLFQVGRSHPMHLQGFGRLLNKYGHRQSHADLQQKREDTPPYYSHILLAKKDLNHHCKLSDSL